MSSPPSQSGADGDGGSSEPAFPTDRTVLEADCDRCPALTDSRECISWGTGPQDARVVVVGEAPGYGDPDADRWRGGNWTGKAYTSRHSGRRIRRLLETVGFGDDVYYTNAVKCFPASEVPRTSDASGETASTDPADSPSNREPTPEERTNCREHLLTELEIVDPDVVLATGKHATKTMLAAENRSLDGFLETVLEPIACEELGVWLVPIFHPSYQDVWIPRIDHDPDSYIEAVGETLTACCDRPLE
nr:uracil-DNA glycosylase [Salinadaptatus halalkaliphilus]